MLRKEPQAYEELWFSATNMKGEDTPTFTQEPWRKFNGLHILRKGMKIVIHTDTFGTVPLLFDVKNKRMASDFRQMNPLGMSFEKLDTVGFWENMIYDYAFHTRTMNKDIIQMPGGSRFEFDCPSDRWSVRRWNYFDVADSCETVNELLTSINNRLESLCFSYWSILQQDGFILLPLSGGLDSRLLAVHLAETGNPDRIIAVTFGFSTRSKEYQIAGETCKELGINRHVFHKLRRDRYGVHSNEFWRNWQGCLSVMHCHLYSFLCGNPNENTLLVSGFFADPIAGYAAKPVSSLNLNIESSNAYRQLMVTSKEMMLEKRIVDSILGDLECAFDEWKQTNPKFSFDEYLYLSQRQSKSYSPLLQIYHNYYMTVAPYSDPELTKLFLSAPFTLRKDKLITRKLIAEKNRFLAQISDTSSSIARDSLRHYLRTEWRKWCSRSTIFATWATNDRLRPVSSYSTEDIMGALRKEHRLDILTALENLKQAGILSKHQHKVLSKKPLRSREVSRTAKILTFSPWIKARTAQY
jgi:asparagine synthetase B (glutamine-hydrolysing)